jgi:lipopolysaccharide export system ATP-binding protein
MHGENGRADRVSNSKPRRARWLQAAKAGMHEICQMRRGGQKPPCLPYAAGLNRVTMTDTVSPTREDTPDAVDAASLAANGGLEVISIAKSYDKRAVLTDISLSVAKGEVLGLLGPNGAGKTTCFYSIMGLVRPDSGRILMDGVDVTRLPMYRRAILGLGYLPQETSIFRGLTVEQNIGAVLELVEPDKAVRASELERLLDEFGLTRLRSSPAMALSGGERRRCEIARALAAKPSIMLLDEPFAGIDPLSISDIRDLVKDLKTRGIGVLITDHNVRETLDIVDRACIIYGGQVLFAGSPEALVADENVRRLYLGEGFTL